MLSTGIPQKTQQALQRLPLRQKLRLLLFSAQLLGFHVLEVAGRRRAVLEHGGELRLV